MEMLGRKGSAVRFAAAEGATDATTATGSEISGPISGIFQSEEYVEKSTEREKKRNDRFLEMVLKMKEREMRRKRKYSNYFKVRINCLLTLELQLLGYM